MLLQQCLPFTVLKPWPYQICNGNRSLQQCLPFTVLKLSSIYKNKWPLYIQLQQCLPFTVLKQHLFCRLQYAYRYVATVLTVYGIETFSTLFTFNSLYSLQQCLPFTVLKPSLLLMAKIGFSVGLQQCLPFTVLKRLSH